MLLKPNKIRELPKAMKIHKNHITIILIVSSIVLLLTLQGLWLRNSYERAYYDLRGETTRLFRSAVYAVRDSAMFQNIESFPPDSMDRLQPTFIFTERVDSLSVSAAREAEQTKSQLQVYLSPKTNPDSAKVILQSLANQYRDGRLGGRSRFVIRMNRDSLNRDSINAQFSRNLETAGRLVPFKVKKSKILPSLTRNGRPQHGFDRMITSELNKSLDTIPVLGSKLQSEWVRVDPITHYSAVLTGVRGMLIKEITPQIFFSCVLTLLTLISFLFMWRSIRSQQRLMALKNDLISNITHELKTPIATVSVALEALKNFKGIDNPKLTGEYLDIAQSELARLTILTDKVLNTSLFDEKGVKVDLERIDLEKIIRDILNSMKLVFEKQKAAVAFEPGGSDFSMRASTVHITNVIYNLLDNALKYSPTNPAIRISLNDLGEKLSLTIADNGLGIPSEFHKKIFEKFFRMPTGDVHNIKGYGLGLSYVEGVVKAHHGAIEVVSEPGNGSSFTITLPNSYGESENPLCGG
jgi:two-component system phosphate regulon sensor histidine kinase PhoR